MKKILKFAGIVLLIAGALAGVYYLLKKLNIFKGCNLDCDNCDCDCANKDNNDEDETDEEETDAESYDSREYVSIQPKATDTAEETNNDEEAEETADNQNIRKLKQLLTKSPAN